MSSKSVSGFLSFLGKPSITDVASSACPLSGSRTPPWSQSPALQPPVNHCPRHPGVTGHCPSWVHSLHCYFTNLPKSKLLPYNMPNREWGVIFSGGFGDQLKLYFWLSWLIAISPTGTESMLDNFIFKKIGESINGCINEYICEPRGGNRETQPS